MPNKSHWDAMVDVDQVGQLIHNNSVALEQAIAEHKQIAISLDNLIKRFGDDLSHIEIRNCQQDSVEIENKITFLEEQEIFLETIQKLLLDDGNEEKLKDLGNGVSDDTPLCVLYHKIVEQFSLKTNFVNRDRKLQETMLKRAVEILDGA